jgi:ISXO2-like transposase domain
LGLHKDLENLTFAVNGAPETLRETAVKTASRKSYLMTDENIAYTKLGKEFSGHGTVNHSVNEYARLGGFIHINNAENYFFIFKRGIIGTYHHISEQHLDRYCTEFDFRYNNRSNLGVEDTARVAKIINGLEESASHIAPLIKPQNWNKKSQSYKTN